MTIPWVGQAPDGTPVRVTVGYPLNPAAPEYTVYLDGAAEPEPYRLTRHVDGSPTRVLTYVPPDAPGVETVGWVYDPHRQELDPAGSLARDYLDQLTIDQLVQVGRLLAADDVKAMQDELAIARHAMTHIEQMLHGARLIEAALALDDVDPRTIALKVAPEWHGTLEELIQAATDAASVPPAERIGEH